MSVGLENEESMGLGNPIRTYLRNAIFGFILGTQIHLLLDLQDPFGSNSFRAKLEVIQLRKSEAMWGEKSNSIFASSSEGIRDHSQILKVLESHLMLILV